MTSRTHSAALLAQANALRAQADVLEQLAAEDGSEKTTTIEPTSAPRLTTDETCRELKISRAKLLRMRDEGAPCHWIGQSPRWDLRELQEWLDARGRKGAPSKPKQDSVVLLKSRGTK
jgi:hypothetical protein